MKLQVVSSRPSYVAPSFADNDEPPLDPALKRRLWRPVVIGSIIVGVLVVALGLWASLTPIASGISANGVLRVEANKKTLRHREGGTVRAILAREGDHVRAGQPLLRFDDVQAKASVDVFQNQYDNFLAQSARFQAESTRQRAVSFPPELTARASDPRVAGLLRDQQFLFASRLQYVESQTSVLNQRIEQFDTHIEGLQVQVDSIDEQKRLTDEELNGYRTLYEKGFAPKTLILRYERSLADLAGRRGALISDISRTREQAGETRLQLVTLREQRESEAAEGLRDMQSKLADVTPRLTAARQTLEGTVVKAPVDGYVLNLTQFTVGGLAGPGEVLMDVVPANAPMVVTVMVRPQDIDEVRAGMDAKVRFDGLNQRWVSPLPAKVTTVSADRLINDKTGEGYFRADLRIDPKDVAKMKRGIKLTPGMPASAMIVTGKRTIMSFLISPITDTLEDAFREQ